jgi:putative endonuclease
MFVTNPIGIIGEEEASKVLEKKGFKIVERNWRMGHLEVDLIAEDKKTIVFAEVKARTTTYGDKLPEEYVDEIKKKRIITAANAYIKYRKTEKAIRFDIIGVLVDAQTNKIIYSEHRENAFSPTIRTFSTGSYSGSWKWSNKSKR